MTGDTLLEALKKLTKEQLALNVAFKCTENNLEGHLDVTDVSIAPADYGQLILLSSS